MQYQSNSPLAGADFVTVLHSLGTLALTKTWTSQEIRGTDRTRNFRHRRVPVDNIFDLSKLLTEIEANPQEGVIRGAYNGVDPIAERRLVNFTDEPHHWVCLDVDKWPLPQGLALDDPAACVAAFISCELPDDFQEVTHHWQLSSSAGKPGSEGVLNAHIWFWLSAPTKSHEMKRWARILKLKVDKTLFNPVQLHYTAAPVFEDGTVDPVKTRSGLTRGLLADDVDLVMPGHEDEPEVVLVGRQDMVDPRSKPGLVGAFCRVYSPADVIDQDLCEGDFEWQDGSSVRINWRSSRSGAQGGVCITDDQLHLFCSHNEDPHENRAVNAFDFVRAHRFGHLDEHTDVARTAVNELPSYRAMLGWVRSLPEMQDEVAAVNEELRAERSAQAAFGDLVDEQPLSEIADREAVVQRALLAVKAESDATSLERVLAPRLAGLDWTEAERGRLAKALQEQFKTVTGTSLPLPTARKLLQAPATVFDPLPDLTSEGAPRLTQRNLARVLDKLGVVVRYDVIKKEDQILVPGAVFSQDNAANASLAAVLSECHAHDMRIQTGMLKQYLTLIADQNQFNPALTWVESAPWDGVDRLQAWYDTVTTKPGHKALKELLMRRWALQAVAVLSNTGHVQARGVLTFQGAQYQGKTRWLKSLAPEGLVNVGHVLDVHNKDHVKIAISYWMTELGEIDATFKRSDLAALKSFISQQTDTFRRPYAAAEGSYPRRTVFFASVNDSQFLRDLTGNSRYWVIPVESIDNEHEVDMQQVWAQALTLQRAGERHWLSAEEMALLNEANEEFTVAEPVEEVLRDKLPWDDPTAEWLWMTANSIAEMIDMTGRGRYDLARIGASVRRINGGKAKRSAGKTLLWAPVKQGHGAV